jgi:hypothetical protein
VRGLNPTENAAMYRQRPISAKDWARPSPSPLAYMMELREEIMVVIQEIKENGESKEGRT